MGARRMCKQCGDPLPETATVRKKYCSDLCRKDAFRQRRSRAQKAGRASAVPDHIKEMKKLINFYTGVDEPIPIDMIRETFHDAVRENISQYVQDNLLGMTEIMVGMAPKALAALDQDLSSHDPYERQRAYQVLLKYVMPLMDKKGKDMDLGQLTVVHRVPVPDTPFGQRFEAEAEAQETLVIEPGDDYPRCYVCKEQKHPDALILHDERNGGTKRYVCRSCDARKRFAVGSDGAGQGGIEDDNSFG